MLNQHKILRVLQLISVLQQTLLKSVQHLASLLKTTHQTVYRSIDLFRELDFNLQRDQKKKYGIIHNDEISPLHFNLDEMEFLRQLILTSGKDSQLKDAVLKNIYLSSERSIIGNQVIEKMCVFFVVSLFGYHILN